MHTHPNLSDPVATILVALQEWLHVLGWDQAHVVSQRLD